MLPSSKIATWNLCLGFQNKRDLVLSELASNKIDVCCLQEIELKHDYPVNLLGSNTFDFEVETNDNKRRVGILIKNTLKYKRRVDLEKKNCHLIIIDLELDKTIRIITLYRSFRPTDRLSATELFTKQLDLIRSNTIPNTILLGDFNLDAEMQHRLDYPHRKLFDLLDQVTSQFNLIQLVKFPTWSRKVNNTFKQSTLDHIYVDNPFNVGEPFSMHPLFGDHSPVVIEVNSNSNVQATEIRRDWRFYSIASCTAVFSDVNFNIDCTDVQAFWNLFENLVINEVDKLAPLVTFRNDQAPKVKPPLLIRTKINRRDRLLKKFKVNKCNQTHTQIKVLDAEIKSFFYTSKSKFIQSKIIPGNSHSLWKAVKIAKNQSNNLIPKNLILNGVPVPENQHADAFAKFFHKKVCNIKNEIALNDNVYNGNHKLLVDNRFFMNSGDILSCIKTLKPKNCEGFDRIPMRIICDAKDYLLPP